jgi:hypothetical protein
MLKQWVSATMTGVDPMQEWGGTEGLDPELVMNRMAVVMDKKLNQLEFMVNNPVVAERVSALEGTLNGLLEQYRDINEQPLSQLDPNDPEATRTARIMALKPLMVDDAFYTSLTNELSEINRAAKAIDPNFNIYTHPRTAKLAHILTRTVGPSLRGYFGRTDPGVEYNAYVPDVLQDYIPDWISAPVGRGASIAYNALDGVAAIAGSIGVAAYDGTTRLASFIEEQMTGQESSWVPTNFFTQDENGNVIPLEGGRFSMPEIAGLVVGALTKEEVIESMASFREAHGRQESFGDLTAQGMINSIATWVASFRGFTATGGQVMGAGAKGGEWLANRDAVVRGTAWMFGSNSARANKLRTMALETLGTSGALGTHDMLVYGHHQGFLNSFTHGAVMAPILRVADGVAGRGEVFLRRKNMPAWLARSLGGMMEGSVYLGGDLITGQTPFPLFGSQSPEGKSLWALMKDPTDEGWRDYLNYVGEMVLGSMVQRAMFGRQQMMQREAASTRRKEQDETRVEYDVEPEDVTGPQAEDLSEVLPQEAREGYREAGRRLRQQGELEQQMQESGRTVEPGPEGYVQKGTENLMGRLVMLTRRRLGKKPTEVGVVSARVGKQTIVIPGKGGAAEFDPKPAMDRLRKRLGPEEFDAAVREGRVLSTHTHPGGDPPSIADLRQYLFKSGGDVPDLVVGPEGAYLIKKTGEPTDTVSLGKVAELGEHRERWTKTLAPAVAKRVAAERGMEPVEVARAFKSFFQGKRLERGQREAARDVHEAYVEFIKTAGREVGMDVLFLTPQELQRSWAGYMETGTFGPAAEGRHEAEARAHYAERAGEDPEMVPITPSQQGEYRRAREQLGPIGGSLPGRQTPLPKQGEIHAFLRRAEEYFGRGVGEMARDMQSVRALDRAAGFDSPEPTPSDRPSEPFPEKGGGFPGQKSERFEPESRAPSSQEMGDLGRLEAGAVPRGTEAVEKMLEGGSRDTPQKMYQRAKRAAGSFADRLGRFFKDDAYREELAKRLETLGYRRAFLKLEQDEALVLAQTDRVRAEVRRAPERTRVDRAEMFEPMLSDPDLKPERRRTLIDDTIRYAVLRDLQANYVRQKRLPNGETIEVMSELPFGTTIEAIQAKIKELESGQSLHVVAAYERMRGILDDAWMSMAHRGLVKAEDRLPDYFPRRIKDWNDIFDALGPGSQRPPVREPIRGYLKQRKGSERLPDISLDALTDYLTRVRVDNAWHDYANEVGWRIQERLVDELAQEGIEIDPTTVEQMSDEEWGQLYEHLERDRGLIVIDVQGGRVGERTLERDHVTQRVMSDIAAKTGLPIIPEAVIGGFFRPDAARGRYLVTKKAYEFLREARTPSGWYKSPLLNSINRIIGKWFKGPALRGIGGLATPFRVARNLVSDTTALFFKTGDGTKALRESLGQLREAHRIVRAHTTGDDSKLTNYEKSMLEEMRYFGTMQEMVRGAEFARDSETERQWIQKVMPESNRLLETISMAARGDFKWAKGVDDYSENILRAAYFLRERFARFNELQGHPDAEYLSAQDAHIKTGEVLVNYNHLTPGERVALNGLLFPFYTWVKGNFARSLGQLVRHPGKQAARYGLYMAPAVIWNMMFAREEEERLWNSHPLIAGRSHLILPWMRDEFGNPFVVSFEDTFGEASRMLGMNTLAQDMYQYAFGHGSESVLAREPVRILDNAKQALNNWTAPWIRGVFGTTYKSKYESLGERAENTFTTDIMTSFRPLADAQAITNTGQRDRSTGERWMKYAPFVGYVDVTRGLPGSMLHAEHLAGRVQRRGAQLSSSIQNNMPRFMAGLVSADAGQMQQSIENVWNEVGDELELAGLSKIHVIARMQAAAERELKKREVIQSGGILSPKFYQLSKTQQAEVLLDILEGR